MRIDETARINLTGLSALLRNDMSIFTPMQGQRQVRFHGPANLNLQVFSANLGINLNLT
jgi:hypothetical protein